MALTAALTAEEGQPAQPAAGRRSDLLFLAGLVAVVGLPLLAGLVAVAGRRWAPVLDLAMTELRVRDVGGSHTPLIGLPGRIGDGAHQGSHPGPLSFWLLAPTYRLLGSSGWALHGAAAVLNLAAVAVALGQALRTGGRRLAAVTAAVLAVVTLGMGIGPLIEPWNPYMPVLWWVAFLLAVWAAWAGDRPALVVLVVSGSLCAQTHVPYLGLCLGLGGLTALVVAARLWRRPSERRALAPWAAGAVALGLVLWAPPTIDQLTEEPGNYGLLVDHFGSPPEEPIGLDEASGQVLEHFDLGHLVVDQLRRPGLLARGELGRHPVAGRGALLLGAWIVLAALAWRRSPPRLRLLHGLVAASSLLGLYSISRVFGVVWYYLMLWLWAVAGLALLALAWSLAVLWRARRPPPGAGPDEGSTVPSPARRRREPAVLAPLALAVVLSTRLVLTAPDTEPSDAQLSEVLDALVDPTAAALAAGAGAATGPDGSYLVGFTDALHIGSEAYGLVSELERRGFRVGMEPAFGVPITHHRTLRTGDATARVQLATGPYVAQWRAVPGAVEVAHVDDRTPAEISELARLRSEVEAGLRAEGLEEDVEHLDTNLFRAAIDQRASPPLRAKMDRMLKIGMPTSVFIAPAGATLP